MVFGFLSALLSGMAVPSFLGRSLASTMRFISSKASAARCERQGRAIDNKRAPLLSVEPEAEEADPSLRAALRSARNAVVSHAVGIAVTKTTSSPVLGRADCIGSCASC